MAQKNATHGKEPEYLGKVSGMLQSNICGTLAAHQSLYCMLYVHFLILASCAGGTVTSNLQGKKLRMRALGNLSMVCGQRSWI